MRISLQIAAFAVLNLFKCAEVAQAKIPLTLKDIPLDAMRIICSYLDNPFSTLGSLDRHFKELFSTQISAKSIFKERFDIPELVTDDIGDNEKELKYIISSYSMFKNPDHVFQALEDEFNDDKKFHVLIPNLIKYFTRIDPERSREDDTDVLIDHKYFGLLLQAEPESFKENCYLIFSRNSSVCNFQKYLVSNPAQLDHFKQNYKLSSEEIARWIKFALATNMPDMIFHAFPKYNEEVFKLMTDIWTGIYIPKEFYPEVFDRINFIIDNVFFTRKSECLSNRNSDISTDNISIDSSSSSESEDEMDDEVYSLLNLIRFGSDVSNIYEERINHRVFADMVILLMCQCASLTNKMDLVSKLLSDFMARLTNCPHLQGSLLKTFEYSSNEAEMNEFFFDVHEASHPPLRQEIYKKKRFMKAMSMYYHIVNIKLNGNGLVIEFQLVSESTTSRYPETLTIHQEHISDGQLKYILETLVFDNAAILESFLVDLFSESQIRKYIINAKNFKLIMRSESIIQLIRQSIESELILRKPFQLKWNELFDILDEPVPPMADIAYLVFGRFCLPKLKSKDQFSRLEKLLGFSISDIFVNDEIDYIHYRYVFKYLIESGKPLPTLPEHTRALVLIDYPSINI